MNEQLAEKLNELGIKVADLLDEGFDGLYALAPELMTQFYNYNLFVMSFWFLLAAIVTVTLVIGLTAFAWKENKTSPSFDLEDWGLYGLICLMILVVPFVIMLMTGASLFQMLFFKELWFFENILRLIS